jgi:hypothetical protein
LFVFASALDQRTASLALTGPERSQVHVESQKLGNAAVPPGISPDKSTPVASAIKSALGDSYRMVMLICAAMAWVSAVIGGLLIEPQLKPSSHAV